MSDFIEIPKELARVITERKHLDSAVDANIRRGMSNHQAYDQVAKWIDRYIPGFKLYSDSSSYWHCRNRKTRKMFERVRGKNG
jgi:pantothenate kinase-related protein Tda10